MYKTIYVPVDNSDHSNQAVAQAVNLGKELGARLVGCHVYAAKMHDYRFKQMEYTLPEEYLEETELDRQRKIHDSLITMGLQLISDCYLQDLKAKCTAASVEFEPKMMDGKHHVEIIRDMEASNYDLTVLGAVGIGRVRDSQIGSVCERVARAARHDVWVVKNLPGNGADECSDTILVGIDGSPQSFGALMTAIELGRRFGKRVETISVYDPYLHYSVFNSVVNVLTEKAAKVFRFEEQNQLHEEIIDTGLAQIYQSHLEVAETMAKGVGAEVGQTLLDGKAFQKILDHVRKTKPWLLVIGRIGVHGAPGETGLGSTTENLLRSCPTDILLSTRIEYPELDLKAEESIRWTPEAEERMKRVPTMVQGIARTAIYRLAVEQGHSVVTSDLLDAAMERFMPGASARETARLAEAIAFERARTQPISICKKCGVAASEPEPVRCSVCQGQNFEVVTEQMLEQIAAREGGLAADTTYDGRKLKWSQDAKRALWTLKDAYQRRRAKARVEKSARIKRLATITLDFARQVVEEETGKPLDLAAADGANGANGADMIEESERRLVGRDAKHQPLLSTLDWSPEAVERLFLIPPGFMRDRTQERAEALTEEDGLKRVELALVEAALTEGRAAMERFIAEQQALLAESGTPPAVEAAATNANETSAAAPSVGKCPWHAAASGVVRKPEAHEAAREGTYLNEVGFMSALEALRKKGGPEA